MRYNCSELFFWRSYPFFFVLLEHYREWSLWHGLRILLGMVLCNPWWLVRTICLFVYLWSSSIPRSFLRFLRIWRICIFFTLGQTSKKLLLGSGVPWLSTSKRVKINLKWAKLQGNSLLGATKGSLYSEEVFQSSTFEAW